MTDRNSSGSPAGPAGRVGLFFAAALPAILLATVLAAGAAAQELYPQPYRQPSFEVRTLHIRQRPLVIVMLGDSLTAGGNWGGLPPKVSVSNEGVGGDSTQGILERLGTILQADPDAVFLQAGINDLFSGLPPEVVARNHALIWDRLNADLPGLFLTVCSLIPVRNGGDDTRAINEAVRATNAMLRDMAVRRGVRFVDLYSALSDSDGGLPAGLTADGVHLKPEGYDIWRRSLSPVFVEVMQKGVRQR
jgi:lysophospholipase L1-like esterase